MNSTSERAAFTCPRCGSDQIQALSLVHESGSTLNRGGVSGLGVGPGGQLQTFGAATGGTSQSALSRRAAPPAKAATDGLLGLGVILLVVGILVGQAAGVPVLGAGIGIAACGLCMFLVYDGPKQWNETEWPKLMEKWRRTFMCGRCGEFFEIDRQQLPGR